MDLHTYLLDRSPSDLAREIGVRPDQVSQWRSRWEGREPSPENCVAIERASGGAVMRWDLRPDDWHRIWPELIGRDGAPAMQIHPDGRPLLDVTKREPAKVAA